MLPFLKPKAQTGVITSERPVPDDTDQQPPGDEAMQAAAQDLISAVHSKDVMATADALRNAFQILGAEPQDDESVEPHSYEAQLPK